MNERLLVTAASKGYFRSLVQLALSFERTQRAFPVRCIVYLLDSIPTAQERFTPTTCPR